ncbi:DUF4132 domain-containing protein [Stagnihabitans tardus]|uniref:DUF4132 domain-containing protein n=1 Tax=Stagnihabitans tardus TaxID=2699202 RepID=A0AAE4Y7R4_9RHOB|nr:DUF4132 domain-containing protein [Stagnihabitans tardus]NBZ86381.1 DUF4132 domain-containing protein [Stagnihabitans tardus]
MSFLSAIDYGLAGKAVSYIQTGEGRTVLAALGAHQAKIDAAVQDLRYGRRNNQRLPTEKLVALMGQAVAHPDWLVRLCEVLVPITQSDTIHSLRSAEKLTPTVKALWLHLPSQFVLLPEAANWLSLPMVAALVDRMGRRADLLQLVFSHPLHVTLNRFPEPGVMKFLLTTSLEELKEAEARLDASSRAEMWQTLGRVQLALEEAVLDHLFTRLADGSAKVAAAARGALRGQDASRILPKALAQLAAPSAAQRKAAVQLLGDMKTPEALEALRQRQPEEGVESLRALIAQFLGTAPGLAEVQAAAPGPWAGPVSEQAEEGFYLSVKGERVALPPDVVLVDDGSSPFGRADVAELRRAEDDYNAKREAESKAKGWRVHTLKTSAEVIVSAFNGERLARGVQVPTRHPVYHPWMTRAMAQITPARRLALVMQGQMAVTHVVMPWSDYPLKTWLHEAMEAGEFDLRTLLRAAAAAGLTPAYSGPYARKPVPSSGSYEARFLQGVIEGADYTAPLRELAPHVVWPLLAQNLTLLVRYLPPQADAVGPMIEVLALLATLPALPQSMVNPVLYAAFSESAQVRKAAAALLRDVPGLEAALTAALADKRQTVRASAAQMMAAQRLTAGLPALTKALKAEKSETARAALIGAVKALGGDVSPWIGPEALTAEAKALITKLKPLPEGILHFSTLAGLCWADGSPIAPEVPEAWARLAVKLKTPGEGALFGLYLDQLRPSDAAAFSLWVLQSWISFDTAKGSQADHVAKMMVQAKQMQGHSYYAKYSLEELLAMVLAYSPNPYLNSGADTKGLLALAIRATQGVQVATAYLKDHGKRVSQAKALVDMLAAMGTPEAVQRLVATSTRFKQKSVREHAEAQVTALAEARGWTGDTLADRSVPSGGLEEGGQTVLEVGEAAKPYALRLGSDLKLRLFNPEGREVQSLPPGTDETTKEAKAQLSAAKAAVKAAVTQQSARLYEAMLAGRRWRLEDWQADLLGHPILSRLVESVIWRLLDEEGAVVASFRPTAEGDFLDAQGDDVALTGAFVDLLHGSHLQDTGPWLQHLKDFEITPLFAQLSRPVMRPTTETDRIETRHGWVIDGLRLRSEAAKYGYDKGATEDGGVFMTYIKRFPSVGIDAVIEFSGSEASVTADPVALQALYFVGNSKNRYRPLTLAKVPPLLLSECWCDLHDIALKGAHDPDWQKRMKF